MTQTMASPATPDNAPADAASAPASVPNPGLYTRVVLVDRQAHAGMRVKPVEDWRIAADTNAILIVGPEFALAAREFPIAFVAGGTNSQGQAQVMPVVLLGLRERENLVVTPEGHWDARFLPAFLRRYPFAYVRTEGDRLSLAVDSAWPGFNDTEGQPLMDGEGRPSAFLTDLMKFLDAYEQDMGRTRAMCAKLVELDLLRGGEINGQLADGTPVKAEGFFMVDEEKLRKLPDATVLELHRSGILGLVHAHLVSMGQVEVLAQKLAQRR